MAVWRAIWHDKSEKVEKPCFFGNREKAKKWKNTVFSVFLGGSKKGGKKKGKIPVEGGFIEVGVKNWTWVEAKFVFGIKKCTLPPRKC